MAQPTLAFGIVYRVHDWIIRQTCSQHSLPYYSVAVRDQKGGWSWEGCLLEEPTIARAMALFADDYLRPWERAEALSRQNLEESGVAVSADFGEDLRRVQRYAARLRPRCTPIPWSEVDSLSIPEPIVRDQVYRVESETD